MLNYPNKQLATLLNFFSLVPGQPLNFKAEPESETSILLSWTPPRSDTISSYELVYKDGEHGEEVSEETIRLLNLWWVRHKILQWFRIDGLVTFFSTNNNRLTVCKQQKMLSMVTSQWNFVVVHNEFSTGVASGFRHWSYLSRPAPL